LDDTKLSKKIIIRKKTNAKISVISEKKAQKSFLLLLQALKSFESLKEYVKKIL
jgi:hypothetical protein